MSFSHDTWQWWLHYGLDGIAGGVIGGAATGFAVWWTLRHERRHAVTLELRGAVSQLVVTALRAGAERPMTKDDPAWSQWMWDLFAECAAADGLSAGTAPVLSRDLLAFRDALARLTATPAPNSKWNVDQFEAMSLCTALYLRLSVWQSSPEKYEKREPMDWKAELASLMTDQPSAEPAPDQEPAG